MKPENAKYYKPMPAAERTAGSQQRMVRVRHVRTGWVGYIYGAGPGRSPARWNNPQIIYVDWYHRKPATGGHKPCELVALYDRS